LDLRNWIFGAIDFFVIPGRGQAREPGIYLAQD
jgi:hypothetical protein